MNENNDLMTCLTRPMTVASFINLFIDSANSRYFLHRWDYSFTFQFFIEKFLFQCSAVQWSILTIYNCMQSYSAKISIVFKNIDVGSDI